MGDEKGVRYILFVESSNNIGRLTASLIKQEISGVKVIIASDIATAKSMVADRNNFFISILDLDLTDDKSYDLIDFFSDKKLPSIVLTSTYDNDIRAKLMQKDIVDYILTYSIDYAQSLVDTIKTVIENSQTKVLIADDSAVFREILSNALSTQLFQILVANDGVQATMIFEQNPDIKLVVTDYMMPIMDGFELTTKLREIAPKEKLAIIAVSSDDGGMTTAKFLKYGANDYIKKPFSKEELISRINNNLDYVRLIEQKARLANTDFLTGLSNRKYLMDTMEIFHANAARGNIEYIVGLLDIDHFKLVNDTYGHAAGDIVLKNLAKIMKEEFRNSDIVARIGGEEFCVVLTNIADQNIFPTFEKLRERVQSEKVDIGDGVYISYTVSMGVCATLAANFEDMLKTADEMLYKAKRSGRNKICPDF
jgi:diguanylate cyclase (GGDEF)-like protein